MIMIQKLIVIFSCMITSFASLYANPVIIDTLPPPQPQYKSPGLVFLSVPIGARAVGTGSTAMGSVDDPCVLHYNPGALGFFDEIKFAVMNQGLPPGTGRLMEEGLLYATGQVLYDTNLVKPEPNWLPWLHSGMRYIYGSAVIPVKRIGTLALNHKYLTTGETEVINPNGDYIGSYISYDIATSVSYGRRFGRLGTGLTAKYIYSFLCPDWALDLFPGSLGGIAQTFAFDFGLICRLYGIGIGASLLNLGPRYSYLATSSERLPTRVCWGISVEPIVLFDSLYHLVYKEQLMIYDIPIHYFVNVKFNRDRSYDAEYLNDDIWRGSGWEFRFLRRFYWRFGSFAWMGNSTGVGIDLEIMELDITRFFGESYHVQITIKPERKGIQMPADSRKAKYLTAASALIAPGAAQFYKGEGIKGTLFFVPGLYVN
jgi:hypothetical protein